MEEEKKDDILPLEEVTESCPWSLGQIVWARMGKYPYWPSIITLDPISLEFIKQTKPKNRKIVHVRFCADKERHNWVPLNNIIPFCEVEEFHKLEQEVPAELRKKNAFNIKSTLKLSWEDAIKEAKELETKSIEQRNELFNPKKKLEQKTIVKAFEELNERKRKESFAENQVPFKKIKQNGSFSASSIEYNDEENEDEIDEDECDDESIEALNVEPPLTPPSSVKDSSDEASNKNGRDKEGVFEIYLERNKQMALDQDADATDDEIREYLWQLWNNMDPLEKTKYRADYSNQDKVYSAEIVNEESNLSETPKSQRKKKLKVPLINNGVVVKEEVLEKPIKKRRSKLDKLKDHEGSDQEEITLNESVEVKSKVKLEIDKDASFELLIENLKKSRQQNLFKGLKQERVCQICEKPGKLIKCKGPCHSMFHLSCVRESTPEPSEAGDIVENIAFKEDLKEIQDKIAETSGSDTNSNSDSKKDEGTDESFKCIDCLSGVAPACFICQERDGERQKCSFIACGKHYHVTCLKKWPQSQWQGERLTCPYHRCHTCSSENNDSYVPRANNEKFARCIRCPSTYHANISCLPAGTTILTGSQIICTKHYNSSTLPINTQWCFICTEGGTLLCCDTCPTSVHLECQEIEEPDGSYMCDECEAGRLPLYGEIVWVKLGNYRWWPALVCYPNDIPANVASLAHKDGEFCVMFLGTRDYYWVHRGRAFLYQEGDAKAKNSGPKKVDYSYKRALQEAKILHDIIEKEKTLLKAEYQSIKPPPFKKIKINKLVGNIKIPELDSISACECDPNSKNACSVEMDCLNRLLMIECNPDICPAGPNCQNQLFAARKYPAMKPFHTYERGWGLKTLEQIKEGQFVVEYVGEVIDEAEYKRRLQQKREQKNENYYFLTIDNTRMIDAEPKGNLSRFMNHSCQPNCETQKWTVNGDTRIGLFALRDIQPGEELTFNYNLASDGETRKPCLCKAPNCSGFIGLKVQKQQVSLVQQKKIEKVEKFKKQRRTKKNIFCGDCGKRIENNEESLGCQAKACNKFYHSKCVTIENESGIDEIFYCPIHFCAECDKFSELNCSDCCNAFCVEHAYSNLWELPQSGNYICYRHSEEYAIPYVEEDTNNKGEALMDDGEDEETLTNNLPVSEIDNSKFIKSPERTEILPKLNSPRGTIVEVHASSEEGEESQKEDIEPINSHNKNKTKTKTKKDLFLSPSSLKIRKKKQKNTEINLTYEQIKDIIGIDK